MFVYWPQFHDRSYYSPYMQGSDWLTESVELEKTNKTSFFFGNQCGKYGSAFERPVRYKIVVNFQDMPFLQPTELKVTTQ